MEEYLEKFDRFENICYTIIVALKKGGIIIEYESKKILLIKQVIIAFISITLVVLFSNITYAEDEISNERIKEFNLIQDVDISRLNRSKVEINDRYSRELETTSRSGETRQQAQVEEKQYTKLEDVKISVNMDLTVRTGLSKEDFKKVIGNLKQDKSKFFYNNAELIYDLCEKYQINEIFFCGLISAESGWNIVSSHRNTHNYISLMSNGKLISYSSVEEGLEVAAKKLHTNYLTPGGKFYNGKTLAGVKKKFCPSSSTWVNLVYGCMSQIMTAVNKTK